MRQAQALGRTSLRVASYNVLGTSLLQKNGQLYRRCHPAALDHALRLPALLEHIGALDADVLALQEGERFEEDWEAPLARMGDKGVYKQRTGEQLDGVALFYRESRLELRGVQEIEFRGERE